MTKILFICHGNICRSPMAEFVMKDLVKKAGLASQFQIESASAPATTVPDKSLISFRCLLEISLGISLTFARLSPSDGQVGYALLTRAPVDAHQKQAFDVVSPRLACVKPVASVHPEPGSNSPL